MTINLIEKDKELLTIRETYEVWQKLKSRYIDAIVILRKDDNYYAFESDAEIITGVMNIKTSSLYQNKYMCIFPLHQTDKLLSRMVKTGYRIAVCEPQFFSLYQ